MEHGLKHRVDVEVERRLDELYQDLGAMAELNGDGSELDYNILESIVIERVCTDFRVDLEDYLESKREDFYELIPSDYYF